ASPAKTGEDAAYAAWANELASHLSDGEPGAYIGFLSDDDPATAREAYTAPTWKRLRSVKAKYDPTNLFRLNQNVPPSES
ncbi:MAG: BBE domain-containing protein, partial [Longimicrobiales bacterium]